MRISNPSGPVRKPIQCCEYQLTPYSETELDLLPLKGKAPFQKNWTTRAPLPFSEAAERYRSNQNVGVRLSDDWLVIDYDPRNDPMAKEGVPLGSYANLILEIGADPSRWPSVRTGGGGLHVYLRKKAGQKIAGSIVGYPGVELKSLGSQVVAAGSIHPVTGALYSWLDPIDEDGETLLDENFDPDIRLAEAPTAPPRLLRMVERGAAQKHHEEGGPDGVSPVRIAELLAVLDVESFRDHDSWFKLMASCHHGSNGLAREEFVEWSTSDPTYADQFEAIGERWDSLAEGCSAPCTIRTLYKHVADSGNSHLIGGRSDPDADFSEGVDRPDASCGAVRPIAKKEIRVQAGGLVSSAENGKQALFEQFGHEIFQARGQLVRVLSYDSPEMDGTIRYCPGATVLIPVHESWLLKRLAQSATWYRVSHQVGGKPKKSPVDPRSQTARIIMNDQGEWPFHHVRAMVNAPTLDVSTGELVTSPGMNSTTGLLATFDAASFPEAQLEIGRDGATERLQDVERMLFRGMPFADEVSRSVAVSSLVTALVRPTMRAAPMHLFDAAMPGSGKSKLASVVGVIATGVEPAASAWASNEEENEKRLSSLLRRSAPVILFDNIDSARGDLIGGNLLNIVLTQEPAASRILGKSEYENLNTRVMLLGTGNNLRVVGDTMRRVVKCRLDARCPDPERRVFDWDPVQVAREMRPGIVMKLLEALAEYYRAGKPCNPTSVGSFEDWTHIRGLMIWCGYSDPALSMSELKARDSSRASMLVAFETWSHAFDDKWVTAADIEQFLADSDDMDCQFGRQLFDGKEAVREALLDGKVTKNWIGKQLAQADGQAVENYYLEVKRTARASRFRVASFEVA
jgi:hypothetical protein